MLSLMEADFKSRNTQMHTIGCFVVWSAAHSPLLWLHRHKEPKLGASLPWVGGGEEALLFDPDQQPAGLA